MEEKNNDNITIRRDLHIFRGTYDECMEQPTENYTIYLAWNTQQIFVGNRFGKKVRYGANSAVYNEIERRFSILEEKFKNLESSTTVSLQEALSAFENEKNEKMEEFQEFLNQIAENSNQYFNDYIKDNLINTITKEDVIKNIEENTDKKITEAKEIHNQDILNLQNSISNKFSNIKTINGISLIGNHPGENIELKMSLSDEDLEKLHVDLTGYAKKDSTILYMSGNQMKTSTNKCVFCTIDSDDSMYKANKIYFYNESKEKYMQLSGGTIEKTIVESIIDLIPNIAAGSYEIGKITDSDLNINVKVNNIDALDSKDLSIRIQKNDTIDNRSATAAPGFCFSISFNIDGNSINSYSVVASGVKKADDDENIYKLTINNYSISFYAPILFGNAESLTHFKNKGTINSTILPGNEVLLYLPTEATRIYGKLGDYELSSLYQGKEILNINSTTFEYFKYSFGVLNNSNIEITVV